jgi:glycerol-3-phosphate dehydrogenase
MTSNATTTPLNISILGAGSYGTALAFVVARNGHNVTIYCRSDEQSKTINNTRSNPKRFSTMILPESVRATSNLQEAVHSNADIIIHCIPAQHTPEFILTIQSFYPEGVPYVSTSKGVHVKTHSLMSEAIPKAFGEDKIKHIPLAYLSGPSFAKEMIAGHPMSVVVASYDLKIASFIQSSLSCSSFRIYVTDDVIGVEVGGALKNPLAIGAGIASGLGFGQSTIAGLVTRGCREMSMLSIALGGRAETLSGLSGVGDLMLTCFSSLSRNNRFGSCLAKGMTVDEAVEEIGEVVEGFPTAKEVSRLAKENHLQLPLFEAVAMILNGQKTPEEALHKIMEKSPGFEMPELHSDDDSGVEKKT